MIEIRDLLLEMNNDKYVSGYSSMLHKYLLIKLYYIVFYFVIVLFEVVYIENKEKLIIKEETKILASRWTNDRRSIKHCIFNE